MERDLQALEVRVEVVAQVGLHVERGDAGEVAAQQDEDKLEPRDQHQDAGHLDEVTEVALGDRPVDDHLDHLRYRRGRGEAAELRHSKDRDQPHVRPQVR